MEHQPSRTSIDQSAYLSFRPGARLRKAREEHGLSLEQVAETLKILPRILLELEADNYKNLPEPVFIRGYLRRYAALMALPVEDVIARFDEYYQADRGAPKQPAKPQEYIPLPRFTERPDRLKPKLKADAKSRIVVNKAKILPVVGGVVLVIIILTAWQMQAPQKLKAFWQQQTAAMNQATASAARENTITLPNTVTTMPSMDTLDLRFTGDTLVVIRDAGGKELANATKKAGENIVVTGESPFSIEFSNAAAVQFRFNDKAIDLKPYTVNGAVNFRLSR